MDEGSNLGDESVLRLREMLADCRRCAVFTGAGISTESGIPDFRSPGGIWTRYRIIEYQEFVASEAARREYWQRKFATHDELVQAQPNAGHLAVARLVAKGAVSAVITQNIDGLHQASGVPAERVIELHGNTTYAHCLDCGRRYELEPIRQAFQADETPPVCESCGGPVKTATIKSLPRIPDNGIHASARDRVGRGLPPRRRACTEGRMFWRGGGGDLPAPPGRFLLRR